MISSGRKGFVNEINVTPFVDVMLVLLIIFMVTAPMMVEGLDVQLPTTSESAPLPSEDNNVVISISKDGQIFINEFETPLDTLTEVIENAAKKQNKQLYLKADTDVPYGIVIAVMGHAKAAGIEHVGMVTVQPEDNSKPSSTAKNNNNSSSNKPRTTR